MDIELYFKQCIARNALFHAYLLWGEGRDVEKISAAHSLAGFLETGQWGAAGPLTDYREVRLIAGEESIGIGQVREARRFLWQRPFRASHKTLAVPHAALLTEEAQNAFLKIIEEPPAQGLIIFALRDPALLVQALQSRFQKIYMPLKHYEASDANRETVQGFLRGTAAARKEIIKQLVEGERAPFDDFIAGLMAALDADPLKHWRTLKELSRRAMLMGRHSTNRRLQLEAVSSLL